MLLLYQSIDEKASTEWINDLELRLELLNQRLLLITDVQPTFIGLFYLRKNVAFNQNQRNILK